MDKDVEKIEFERELLQNIELIDEVLNECGEPKLLENENFQVTDKEYWLRSNYLVMETSGIRSNTLPFQIWFEGKSLRIDIDGIPETREWSKEMIEESPEETKDFLRRIMTGYVLIETRRGSRFIQFFDSDGFFIDANSRNNCFHFLTGLYLFRHSNFRRVYKPLLRKK